MYRLVHVVVHIVVRLYRLCSDLVLYIVKLRLYLRVRRRVNVNLHNRYSFVIRVIVIILVNKGFQLAFDFLLARLAVRVRCKHKQALYHYITLAGKSRRLLTSDSNSHSCV